MQNIDLICVGKLNAKYFAEGVAEYQKRLSAFASFRIIELPEEKIEEKNASDAVVKKALDKEGKAILSSVRKGAAIVAMCIEGKQISSDELAQFLADRANSGAGDPQIFRLAVHNFYIETAIMRIHFIAFPVITANQLCIRTASVHQDVASAVFRHHYICFKRFSINGKHHLVIFLADQLYFGHTVSYMNFHN